jgi:hypothetical protein
LSGLGRLTYFKITICLLQFWGRSTFPLAEEAFWQVW